MARDTGTNETISTYDSAGGKDFSVLATWESATDNDLVTATNSEALEIFKGSHDDQIDMIGGTYDASFFRILRPAPGEGHIGIPVVDGTVAAFVSTADIDWFRSISQDFTQIQDLVLKMTVNSASTRHTIQFNGGDEVAIGNIVIDCTNAGAGDVDGILNSSGGTIFMIDNLAINAGDTGLRCSDGVVYMYNNSATGCTNGIRRSFGTLHVVNNNSWSNSTNNFLGTLTTDTTNSTSTPTVVDAANDNYALLATDTAHKGAGTDLSADVNFAFNDDLNIKTRNQWDIGAFRYQWPFIRNGVSSLNVAKINDILIDDVETVAAA